MTQPSAHYRQHHDVEAPSVDGFSFRQAWRVQTRLDHLLADGAITLRQWHAAVAFREDLETAARSAWRAPVWLSVAAGASSSRGETIGIRLDALARLRHIANALGPFACALLEACIARDWSWAFLGRRLGVDPKTARAWTVTAIKALALL
ncbi:MAG TPA: hypothetical protein VLN57_13430 [Xanthobacteraceae bacterium]|nr:hypothetical protein [Xanthobacteraceae bacterium]